MEQLKKWFRQTFSDPQVVILIVVILLVVGLLALFGQMLAPALVAVVIAYLLDGVILKLERWRVPRLAGTILVSSVFVAFALVLGLIFLPKISGQVAQLVQQIPSMIAKAQKALMALPEQYPQYVSPAQISELMTALQAELTSVGQSALTYTLNSFLNLIELVVYMVLVPLMIFFFLMDKVRIIAWISNFLPDDYSLVSRIWKDVDRQIGNYIRGKFWEILIVWSVSYVVFTIMGLQYTMLLALFIGLSVLVPYVGATVMTLPVLLIGMFQWGWGSELVWALVAYGIIQLLDGNVLAPLLLSNVTNIHPVAIILAVLLFGGLWGFWGVFFAIPLATLVQAIIKAWPRKRQHPLAGTF